MGSRRPPCRATSARWKRASAACLLNRTSRKLTLTEAGEIYFQKVEDILRQIAEGER